MQHGKIPISDEDRSILLNVFVKFRTNQNSLLEKYKNKYNKNSLIQNKKINNNSILLWEIIHFIAEANFGNRSVSVSDIYLSLGISKSTSIRCVALLQNMGILKKTRDSSDRRRAVITLTDEFKSEFMEYLDFIISELLGITGMPKSDGGS